MSAPRSASDAEPSLGELFSQLGQDFGQLVRDEVQLAKVEITADVRDAARVSAFFGAAAYAGVMAVLLFAFALAWALAEVLPIGLAFFVVGAVWSVAGALLYLRGRKQMHDVNLKPEETIATIQEDVQWAKQQMS